MKKILFITIVTVIILTIGIMYYTDDILTVGISSLDVQGADASDNYIFKLTRNGNLYAVCDIPIVESVFKDKKWIKQNSTKIKLSRNDTKKILNKTEEIFQLYYKYKPELEPTNMWRIHILYKNKYLMRFPIEYPEPYEHMTGPQVPELLKLLADVSPFEFNSDFVMYYLN